MNKNPYDPDAILISFHRRMGRSVAGKHSGKHNLGQKTPIHHSRARQSVIKKQTSKVKQGIFCYYVTNLKRMIRTSLKTAGVYKVRYLCLVGKKLRLKRKIRQRIIWPGEKSIIHSFFMVTCQLKQCEFYSFLLSLFSSSRNLVV